MDVFLANVRTLVDLAALVEERVAERDLIDLLPALSALGLFNVLGIRNGKLRASIDGHRWIGRAPNQLRRRNR